MRLLDEGRVWIVRDAAIGHDKEALGSCQGRSRRTDEQVIGLFYSYFLFIG